MILWKFPRSRPGEFAWSIAFSECVTSIIGCVRNMSQMCDKLAWNPLFCTYLIHDHTNCPGFFWMLLSWYTSMYSSFPINSVLHCCWAILEILPFLEYLVQFALWYILQPLLLSGWAILQLESLSMLSVLLSITLGSWYRVVKRLGEYGKLLPSDMKYWLWGLYLGHFLVEMDYTKLLKWAFVDR